MRSRIQSSVVFLGYLLLLATCRLHAQGEGVDRWPEVFRVNDSSLMQPYTLRIALEEPANFPFQDQGTTLWNCTLTHGPKGMGCACHAEQLPQPVYHAPGVLEYQNSDFDSEGRLGVAMRVKWFMLKTDARHECYEEQRAFYVGPQGDVEDAGLMRTINRYRVDEQGMASWSYVAVRRIWWALGHGFAPDVNTVRDAVTIGARSVELRGDGTLLGFGSGNWNIEMDSSDPKLVRSALFSRASDFIPLQEIRTFGARRFGDLTLAEEGTVATLFGAGNKSVVRRVVLKEFVAKTDDHLLAQLHQALETLEGTEVQVLDYRADPKRPVRSRFYEPHQD